MQQNYAKISNKPKNTDQALQVCNQVYPIDVPKQARVMVTGNLQISKRKKKKTPKDSLVICAVSPGKIGKKVSCAEGDFSDGFLDTLANGWNKNCKNNSINTLQNLKKRAKAKHFTNKFVLKLIDLHSPLEKAYWNTYFCNHTLEQEGKKIIGRYCGNRWCVECNRIRTAKLINGYKPVVDSWNQAMYMILTAKNVKGPDLRSRIQEMNEDFRKITDLIRKRDGIFIEAIRTIEVTYNWKTDEYHPHFNVVINGKEIGRMIINEWLQYFTPDQANERGQYLKPVTGGTLNEMFKYVVKFDDKTPAGALDTIFQALRKMKIVCPTGVKKVSEEIQELVSIEIPELPPANRSWWWDQEKKDWVTRICWPEPEGVKLCKFIEKRIKLSNSS